MSVPLPVGLSVRDTCSVLEAVLQLCLGQRGGQLYSTQNNQEITKDSNQAEIFFHQLITNYNEVAALNFGCIFSC